MMGNSEVDSLLNEQSNHLAKLRKIVNDTIVEEELIINNLLHPPKEILTRGQSISDRVARFGGSWNFIIIFILFLFTWVIYNTWASKAGFDPYPFILMNLILSFVAALQAPIIMMSQNRQEEKDRMRNENDYLINLKAEMEIRRLHQKVDLLIEEEIKTLFDSQAKQFIMLQEIDSKLKNLMIK